MIPKDFYCPECGELWDQEMCLECGFEEENFGKPTPKDKNKDGYYDKVNDRNKVRRVPKEGKDS